MAGKAETIADETPQPAPESKVAKEKAPRVQQPQSNGVTMPSEGTKTRRVWDIADEISQKHKRPALRNEVMDAGLEEGLSRGTIATQYGKWTTFHGVSRDDLNAVRASLKPAEEPKAEAAEGGEEE